jgi:hypothetical protein
MRGRRHPHLLPLSRWRWADGGTFTFNAENQMTQAAASTTTGYVYGGDGKRVDQDLTGIPPRVFAYNDDSVLL